MKRNKCSNCKHKERRKNKSKEINNCPCFDDIEERTIVDRSIVVGDRKINICSAMKEKEYGCKKRENDYKSNCSDSVFIDCLKSLKDKYKKNDEKNRKTIEAIEKKIKSLENGKIAGKCCTCINRDEIKNKKLQAPNNCPCYKCSDKQQKYGGR